MKEETKTRSAIPVMRYAHLEAFTGFLRRTGAPVERELRKAGLPTTCPPLGALVPITRVWRFFDSIDGLDVDGVGWAVGDWSHHQSLNSVLISKLKNAPRLYGALLLLSSLVRQENSHIQLGLLENEREALFWVKNAFSDKLEGYHHAQSFSLMTMLSVLRDFLGEEFMPLELGIESDHVPEAAQRALAGVSVRTSSRAGYIRIPKDSLMSTRTSVWGTQAEDAVAESTEAPKLDQFSLPETLRGIVEAYLEEGCLSVQHSAELLGVSPRTLRRRLADAGLTYSALVERVRLSAAEQLLKDPGVRIVDVAFAAGYRDPSNFSRAFRRSMGMTPRRYREILQHRP